VSENGRLRHGEKILGWGRPPPRVLKLPTLRDSSRLESTKYRSDLITLLSRLYVLRDQIFHGCSTDRSSRNRPSLIGLPEEWCPSLGTEPPEGAKVAYAPGSIAETT